MKQMAYARRLMGGEGTSKKQAALDSGYSSAVSNSVSSHIENKKGFHNAMSQLAKESNNLALSVLHEFEARGLGHFSNKDLVSALNAIGNAWSRFNKNPEREKDSENPGKNKLRNVVLQRIENQTFIQGDGKAPREAKAEEVRDITPEEEVNLDF